MVDGIRSTKDLALDQLVTQGQGKYHPSPKAWEDQLLYFLLPDRFSDGRENKYTSNDGDLIETGSTPPFQSGDVNSAVSPASDPTDWQSHGNVWNGGTIAGLISKLGYLQRLGITAVWIGPVFKQIKTDKHSYHGYGVQNFLEVDPHFGTKEEYKELVAKAHKMGMYIIQDIICNHAGDVFAYEGNLEPNWTWDASRGSAKTYPVKGFYATDHKPENTLPFTTVNPSQYPESAIWPLEFQDGPTIFKREGKINNWENDAEYLSGDFYTLKELDIGIHDPEAFTPTPALKTLVEVFKYWIAYADLDAFRLDTVKHMGWGPTRYFCNAIHEFATSLGKENFYIIGEITGGNASKFETVTQTGLNAALGVTDLQQMLWELPKGSLQDGPKKYFDLFRNATFLRQESHAWVRDKLVTMLDDHDQVWRGSNKGRFCCDSIGRNTILAALALNMTTLGIPCIYYGSEQGLDGAGGDGLDGHGADQWIREAMFGGRFGAFRSRDRHCFQEDGLYVKIAELAEIRRANLALTRGRQYLREISEDGSTFYYPRKLGEGRMQSVVAWSRIFNGVEIVCAINTDVDKDRKVWVTVDAEMHRETDGWAVLYTSTEGVSTAAAVRKFGERLAVQITVPAAGFVMFKS